MEQLKTIWEWFSGKKTALALILMMVAQIGGLSPEVVHILTVLANLLVGVGLTLLLTTSLVVVGESHEKGVDDVPCLPSIPT